MNFYQRFQRTPVGETVDRAPNFRDEAWTVWEAALKEHPEHPYLREVVGRHRVTQSEPHP